MIGSMRLRVLGAAFLLVHGAVLFADVLAPYDPRAQHRELPFAPPTTVRFVDAEGQWRLRPFVYRTAARSDAFASYEEDRAQVFPVRFFVPSEPYRVAGVTLRWRLFGIDEPAQLFLAGADGYGRDQFSRLLHGGRISLLVGLLATFLTIALGLVLGIVAGFYGGWLDDVIMRIAELFLSLPWIYLLFAVRAALPLHLPPERTFLLIVLVIGLVGWTRPARLIRGVVLSARTRDYVLAARASGANTSHLLHRHLLPQTAGVAVTQAARTGAERSGDGTVLRRQCLGRLSGATGDKDHPARRCTAIVRDWRGHGGGNRYGHRSDPSRVRFVSDDRLRLHS